MPQIYTSKVLLCAGALLAFGSAVAFGQDTTRTRRPTSTKRIPISKEGTGAGEVARVDTVVVYRTDTLRTQAPAVHDTLRVTNTVTRVDTVTVTPPVPPIRLPNGFYFGAAGGVSAPNGALFTPNSAGPSAQVQLGWQNAKQVIGGRVDVNWTKPGEDSQFSGTQGDPDILNFSADVKLQLPWLTHTFGRTHRFGIYGIGGYTFTEFKNLPMRIDGPGNFIVFSQGNGSWQHQNGWNAGGGLSLEWGRSELFLESRVLAFDPSNAPQSRQIPFMFGMNWY
jgi:hypothetical protein